MDIMRNVLRQKEAELRVMDCWDFQVNLGKKIYEQCVNDNCFFPPTNNNTQ